MLGLAMRERPGARTAELQRLEEFQRAGNAERDPKNAVYWVTPDAEVVGLNVD